ncbi:bifunctional 2-polyprenyl-6-hydroxyphenol methylase/3-demethylubiquinol 3-O-methyltransferase UbiG [Asticcacaulis sp. AC402]|uniref:class I SAM-dependent methyltransferase n=1 Tax=Asticcacaulis sp. AC402 TaxID=1282361 RepID=UPI0003C40559|nr:class I SAM-dependent methyltransferase [Asticcacaulis sp. AC402]ESQ77275.1 SAM-dependent methlyltransferase [Asticcacaulis sp. AC402]
MRALKDIQGLKFPDDYIIRHFYKTGLQNRTGHVLEVGCAAGNNLMLYADYGWQVTGVDILPEALAQARHNLGPDAQLIEASADDGLPAGITKPVDVVLLPNVLCYLRDGGVAALAKTVRAHAAPGASLFVRTRLIDDYRYGKGEPAGPDSFILDTVETGEAGLFHRFYSRDALVDLITGAFGVVNPSIFHIRFDNHQAGQLIANNSDLVIWAEMAK